MTIDQLSPDRGVDSLHHTPRIILTWTTNLRTGSVCRTVYFIAPVSGSHVSRVWSWLGRVNAARRAWWDSELQAWRG